MENNMELDIYEREGTISLKDSERVKDAISAIPFLLKVFEKKGRVICRCPADRAFFVMDKEAFHSYGEKKLAKNTMPKFVKMEPKFYYFGSAVTSACNFACSYCYGLGKDRTGKTASWALLKESIDFISKNNPKAWVSFFAPGEQMLYFPLFKRTIEYIQKKMKPKKMLFSSNGSGKPENYLAIADRFQTLQISIDGNPKIQEKQRPLKGGGSSSALVEKTIKELVKAGKKVNIKITVTNEHFRKEKQTFKYFHDLGTKMVALSPLSPLGLGKTINTNFKKLIESELKMHELFEYSGICSHIGIEATEGYKEIVYCPVGHSFNVSSDGIVGSCILLGDRQDLKLQKGLEQLVFGQFNEKKKKFELNEKKVKELREIHKKAECWNCDFKLCWGGCPVRNIQKTGSIEKIDKSYCWERKTEFFALARYKAEKEIIKLKPWIEEKNGKMFLCMQFNEFPLKKSSGKKISGNPFIEFNPSETDLEQLLEKIIALNERSKLEPVLFLLSPKAKGRLNARNSIKFKLFLHELKKNKVFFKVSKPIKITDTSNEKEQKFYDEFCIPKNCFECLELFKVKNGNAYYCNGTKGPKISNVFDRQEIFEEFEKTALKAGLCENMEKTGTLWNEKSNKNNKENVNVIIDRYFGLYE